MKYFHIDAIIDKELFNKFLEFCNLNGEDDWTIILNTSGGWIVNSKSILRIINERKNKCTLILHEAYSAGFYIFYEAKCKRVMCVNSKGMIHLAQAEMYMKPNGKPSYYEDECIIKNWKENKDDDNKWVKQFLTKKEFKEYKKGEDIYFSSKRMKNIFPDIEVI